MKINCYYLTYNVDTKIAIVYVLHVSFYYVYGLEDANYEIFADWITRTFCFCFKYILETKTYGLKLIRYH